MSYYERSQDNRRPRRRTAARNWAAKALTPAQKSRLAILAKDAYEIQCRAGLCDTDENTFRHAQVAIATGKNGLRECDNSHFRSIKAHFLRLIGRTQEADATWAKTGRVDGSEEIGDTHENRETAHAVLRDLVRLSDGAVSAAYVAEIAADKFHGLGIQDLRASQLQDLVFTLAQRLRQKLPHFPL